LPFPYFILLLILYPLPASAEDFHGRVVRIVDGDTLVIEAGRQRRTVHLMGIDAPERVQDFGTESQSNLAAVAFNREARGVCTPQDRQGKSYCRVWVQPSDCPRCGQTLDLGHAQVLAGMAWHLPDPAAHADADMHGRYQSSELMAQMRRLGLWGQRNPQRPWQWRQHWNVKDE